MAERGAEGKGDCRLAICPENRQVNGTCQSLGLRHHAELLTKPVRRFFEEFRYHFRIGCSYLGRGMMPPESRPSRPVSFKNHESQIGVLRMSPIASVALLTNPVYEDGSNDQRQPSLLNTILDHFPGGIAVYDGDLRLTICNEKLKELLEYPDHLFVFGMPSMEQIFRFNALRGEYGPGNVEYLVASRLDLAKKGVPHVYERKRPNGQVLEVRGVPLATGGFLSTYVDVSLQKRQSNEPPRLQDGKVDMLTGLSTLSAMEGQLDGLLRGLQHSDVACLHCIDLDQFAELNKIHGTIVGDFILKEVAVRLSKVIRGTDFLARTGGDRFQILQSRVLKPSDVTHLATRLIEAIRQPLRCGDIDITINASVGFSIINDKVGMSVDAIIQKANNNVVAIKRKQRKKKSG
jgi:diguanylate cyclase (GGDEF)-like protein